MSLINIKERYIMDKRVKYEDNIKCYKTQLCYICEGSSLDDPLFSWI